MKIKFSIDYRTYWGQKIYLIGSEKELGSWDVKKAVPLNFKGGESWEIEINFSKEVTTVSYKFLVFDESSTEYEIEFGDNRKLNWHVTEQRNVSVSCVWRSAKHVENALHTSPFKNALLGSQKRKGTQFVKSKNYQFNLRAGAVSQDEVIGIVGECPALGNWDDNQVHIMNRVDQYNWSANIQLSPRDFPSNYKYVICKKETKKILEWENGKNRSLNLITHESLDGLSVISDEYAIFKEFKWRGAGVAIPVFSIRTKESTGVGEFSDIKLLVDWAVATGMKLIQILPVNDTEATNTWKDSYPYAAISVFALHPVFLNVWKMGLLSDSKRNSYFKKAQKSLNQLEEVDYEKVMELKKEYAKELFGQEGDKVMASKDFQEFLDKNKSWLPAYAMFAFLRDKYHTPDFKQWKTYQTVTEKQVKAFTSKTSKNYKDIGYYLFIQYFLDKQLKEATTYARQNGVVLKGDIPIGIYRFSVDAWISPELFNMDSQAGAPPDDFSVSGQNWGFPTYNWDEMAKDGFAWWKNRLQKMTDFFDVFRIDHILGFFRIWEIPIDAVEGLLGYFNPALPYSESDLQHQGISFNYDRLCKPFIRDFMFEKMFGDQTDLVKHTFFDHQYHDVYHFKTNFDTQQKLKAYFDQLIKDGNDTAAHNDFLRFSLYKLISEVVFIEDKNQKGKFNPRIAFHSTYSYQALDNYTKQKLDQLYVDYYYHRHNEFWEEKAMSKLPALKDATEMLICGEDLGMVPDCVPGVMDSLKILSLAIQRMPNDSSKEFWHPSDTPYLSVCSTSSHDMSTLRGWWEEDEEVSQSFYSNILGHGEKAPFYCETHVVKEIINQHLYSPSMWAIFPIQDLVALDGDIRRNLPAEERINVPANPEHYWRYRFHMNIEDLLKQTKLNTEISEMVLDSGRNQKY